MINQFITELIQLPVNNSQQQETWPNLIIIGAMKCGTTSLHHYLNLHPEIQMAKSKELNFFVEEINWTKGVKWYKSHFDSSAKIRGESSPSYTAYPKWQGIPEKIHSVINDCKLIYIVRDPIERMISHYINRYAEGKEHRTINEALADYESDYFFRSRYFFQLQHYLQYFPLSNILIITLEELEANTQETLEIVLNYLNVQNYIFPAQKLNKLHSSLLKRRKNDIGFFLEGLPIFNLIQRLPLRIRWPIDSVIYYFVSQEIERPQLNEDLRNQLIDQLKEDVYSLRKITGKQFNQWCL